ncbi:MAG TPA: endonuclease/exonuclease/phosphatase family protein [Saprospiraceae bacterium]|nr:endonuclease/exonuclease/phosphatase family protein [Saprospiraceae bacterium]
MTRARSKPRTGRLKKLILAFNFLFIFILALTYATPMFAVERWGWFSLFALTYPFVLLANVLFAIGWIFFRSWFAVLSIITILAGTVHHQRYIQLFPSGKSSSACQESIRLLSYNTRGLSMVPVKKDANYNVRIDSVYNALADLKEFPDIICLQEAYKGELIAKRFGLEHSYHGPKSSLWLLSRFPIEKHGYLDGAEESPSAIWADIKTPQGTLRVYNMHLVSNRVTNTTEELIQDMDLKNENTWDKIKFIVSRYRQTTEKRAKEALSIQKHLAACKHPAIITGDGNDPPLSHTYKVLQKGLKDSFVEKGFGISTTYESTLPLLRIDYVLGTKQILFKDHSTYHISYSDHYPISTGICLQSKSGS